MRGLSYKRGLAALTAMAAVVTLFGACGGAGRKVLVEDKIGRLKRDISKVRFAIRTTKTLIPALEASATCPTSICGRRSSSSSRPSTTTT